MPYITLAQIKARLPDEITSALLDDTSSGAADLSVWDEIVEAVRTEIDGKLGQRYPLPLATVPDLVASIASVLAAELCYQRRNYYGEANPWTVRATAVRKTLDAIAEGDQPLTPTAKKQNAPALAITETAKTFPSSGNTVM